jgi:hypothetical protein
VHSHISLTVICTYCQVVHCRGQGWESVARRVFLRAADYQKLITQYGNLSEIIAAKFAYYLIKSMTGSAAVTLQPNHISNDTNVMDAPGFPCMSSSLLIVEPLGKGAFGAVYSAFDKAMDGEVAVKVLTVGSELPQSKLTAKDVRTELAAVVGLSNIRHAYLTCCFRIEHTAAEQHVLVMEKMHSTLRQLFKQAKLNYDFCERYMRMMCLAVHAMHINGWYHRDIKPANMLISRDGQTIKLADFGMATQRRKSKSFAGSKAYMAPEMQDEKEAKGKDLRQADLWSLGALCWEMAIGKRLSNTGLSKTSLPKLVKQATDRINKKDSTRSLIVSCLNDLLRWDPEQRQLPISLDYSNTVAYVPGTVIKCAHFPAGAAEASKSTPGGTQMGVEITHLRYKSFFLVVSCCPVPNFYVCNMMLCVIKICLHRCFQCFRKGSVVPGTSQRQQNR